MSDVAIHIEGLGKRYRLGERARVDRQLREVLTEGARGLVRRLRPGRRGEARAVTAGPHAEMPPVAAGGRYGPGQTFHALRDVSFDVREGEVVGVIGRNGAGKSTLLKILSRITDPTSGQAEIYGRVGSLLEVGTGFHPELTGRENIFLNGAILGMSRAEIRSKFEQIIAFSEIGEFLDTPVKRYSSGMYVRLAFAVAAHLEPEILIVDEVLAVGDAAFQRKCLGKMQDVAQHGRTVLFVSHNMRSVASLCTRAIMLQDGCVLADGQPDDVINTYLSQAARDDDRSPVCDFALDPKKAAEITQARILDHRGQLSLEHALVKPITLEFDYVVRRPCENLVCMVHVRSPHDDLVLATAQTDWHNHHGPGRQTVLAREPGRYTASVRIEAPLLNTGRYELVPILVNPRAACLDTRRGMFIDVVDYDSFASALFTGGRGGVLAVPLQWSDQRVDDPADHESGARSGAHAAAPLGQD